MGYLIFFLLIIIGSILFGMAFGLKDQLKMRKNFKRAIIIITIFWIIIYPVIISTFKHNYLFLYYGLNLFLSFFGMSFLITILVRGGITGKEEKKSEIEHYQLFYKTHFGWTVDFSRVLIPPKPEETGWTLLIIAKGLTCNKVYEAWSKLFKCWKYTDHLDKDVPTNIRTSSDHYAIWVRDGQEPDVEFLGKSTQEVDSGMKIGVTLLERMLLELKYFAETGKHLDTKGISFCSGSRDSGGGVPGVSWHPGDRGVIVDWSIVNYFHSVFGVRRAVSL